MEADLEPTDGLVQYRSIKHVLAGEITEIVPAGCYVREADGSAILRIFEPKMTERYQPKVGDFWVIYEDGYQSLSPRAAFLGGYVAYGVYSVNDAAESSVNPHSATRGDP
jgi:hypothetical protein